MNAEMPYPLSARHWDALLARVFLVLFVGCILSSSCVPIISSSQKAAGPDPETKASPQGLIKPKLQDEPSASVGSDARKKESAEQLVKPQGKSSKREEGVWNRLFGMLHSGRKSATTTQASGLIKPKLSDTAEHKPAIETASASSSNSSSPTVRTGTPQTESQDDGKPPAAPSQESVKTWAPERDSKDVRESTNLKVQAEPFSDKTATGSEEMPRIKTEKKPEQSSADPQAVETTFKKHDHAKYITTIRNKAIDTVNKESDCDIARLCRDSSTDEWSLTLYIKTGKFYSYTVYAWDEIDGNWVPSYTSEKKPITGMKKHLAFSAAGKTCKVLKGSDHADLF